MDTRAPHRSKRSALDAEIGRRIRAARRRRGLSQSGLGGQLGISFQQVQKYERGANRVSALTLHDIARLLDQPLAVFFAEKTSAAAAGHGSTGRVADDVERDAATFARLPRTVRSAVLALIRDVMPTPDASAASCQRFGHQE